MVQVSFADVLKAAPALTQNFYETLFILDPSLRPMFKQDLKESGEKLMATLKVAIMGLSDMEKIKPILENLGRGHVTDYGVKTEHYDTVGRALIMSLEKCLGPSFSDEIREVWLETYRTVAGVMIAAAEEYQKNTSSK